VRACARARVCVCVCVYIHTLDIRDTTVSPGNNRMIYARLIEIRLNYLQQIARTSKKLIYCIYRCLLNFFLFSTSSFKLAPDYARFVIGNGSKLAIFYSYKMCKRCKWTYSSNLHPSFNIRVNSLAERFFWRNQRTRIIMNRA